jgi:hypothetical protein
MNFNVVELRKTTLAHVSQDKVFWVCRGDRIDNIYDLANCVESLTPEQFKHHVSFEGKRNDFAQWILDVLNNSLLAKDLNLEANLKDQKHMVKTIRDHVAWLEHA